MEAVEKQCCCRTRSRTQPSVSIVGVRAPPGYFIKHLERSSQLCPVFIARASGNSQVREGKHAEGLLSTSSLHYCSLASLH